MLFALGLLLNHHAVHAKNEAPRVSAIYWGKQGPAEDLKAMSRFSFVILGLSGNLDRMQATISTMVAENPDIKLGTYTVLVEFWKQAQPSDKQNFETFSAIEENDWWLYDGAGARVQWSPEYKTHLINITHWARPDRQGLRFPQWLATHKAGLYRGLNGLDYVFLDNLWYSPRPRTGAMDWKRNGRAVANSDPEVGAAFRQGLADYVSALRKELPAIKLMANTDNDLDYPEYKNLLEGAYLECSIGRNWSIENKGWDKMMALYRKAIKNTSTPNDVILEACGEKAPDLRLVRYGLASALLEDGWFGYKISGVKPAFFADEYSAPLGRALEPPPVQARSAGIWSRQYVNGMVLVNPGPTPAMIDVGAGYIRLKGTQAPDINDGKPARMVTLPAKDGLILLRGN